MKYLQKKKSNPLHNNKDLEPSLYDSDNHSIRDEQRSLSQGNEDVLQPVS